MIFSDRIYRSFLQRNKGLVAIAFGLHLLSNLFSILIPLFIGKYYELVFGLNSTRAMIWTTLSLGDIDSIDSFFWLFGIMIFLKVATLFGAKYYNGVIGEKIILDLRKDLYRAQLNIPLSIYKEKGIGKYLLRFSGDLQSIKQFFTKGFVLFAADLLLLVFAMVLLHSFSSTLSYLIGALLVICFAGLIFLNQLLFNRIADHRNKKSVLLSFVNRTLISMPSLKALNKQSTENRKFDKYAAKVYTAGLSYQLTFSLFSALIPGITYSLLFTALTVGYLLSSDGITGASLLVTIMLMINLLPVMRRLLKVRLVWQKGEVSTLKVNRIFDLQEVNDSDVLVSPLDAPLRVGELTINDKKGIIHLSSKNPEEAIDTVLFPNPLTNQVAFDIKHWRKHVAFVDDRYGLMGRRVFEAISYSRSDKKRNNAQSILDKIQKGITAEERLSLNQKIGQNGELLSPLQTKICLIARALLTNKPLIICRDIATSLTPEIYSNVLELLAEREEDALIILLDKKTEMSHVNISMESISLN